MGKMMSNGTRLMNETNAANALKVLYRYADDPEMEDAIEYAIQYMEEKKEYRWHKKPENGWDAKTLPEEDMTVGVLYKYRSGNDDNVTYKRNGVGEVIDGRWLFINGQTGWRDLDVLAWREIEQPEEGQVIE